MRAVCAPKCLEKDAHADFLCLHCYPNAVGDNTWAYLGNGIPNNSTGKRYRSPGIRHHLAEGIAPGYYSIAEQPMDLFKCPNTERCPGGLPGECAPGLQGAFILMPCFFVIFNETLFLNKLQKTTKRRRKATSQKSQTTIPYTSNVWNIYIYHTFMVNDL